MKKIRTLGSDHTSKKNSNGLSCVVRCMNKKGTEANTAHLSFKITLKYYRLVHLEGERQLKESRMLILLSTWQMFILSLIYIRICRESSLGWNCTCINMVDVISRERRLMPSRCLCIVMVTLTTQTYCRVSISLKHVRVLYSLCTTTLNGKWSNVICIKFILYACIFVCFNITFRDLAWNI